MRQGPIIFDVDGVLADFHTGYVKVAQSLGLPVPEEGDWDAWLDERVWKTIKERLDFWESLDPLVGEETCRRIRMLGDSREIYFATSRMGTGARDQTLLWLYRYRLSWGPPTVVLTTRKGEFAKVVGAAYLIDDKAGNAVYTQYESPGTVAVLLDKSWNQFDQRNLGSKVIRVKHVDEFLDLAEHAS